MTLTYQTLDGETVDRVAVAIERIRSFVPEEGYYVAFSGGKDSIVTLDLVRRAGVKHDVEFNLTTVDPPEVVRFIREHYPDVSISRPKMSMFALIVKKHMPPTRIIRYCCDNLKERGGAQSHSGNGHQVAGIPKTENPEHVRSVPAGRD